jgi:glutamate racemase
MDNRLGRHPVNQDPIGLFDSGIGGLSILHEVHRQFPGENLLYLADQAHVPYGSRSLEEVRQLSSSIVSFLLGQGVKLVTVACNTASAASLHALREQFPDVPFVGMEPAVKPAAANTRSQTVGVLATPATFQGELYASVLERFAEGVTVLQETLPGLVEQIEGGLIDSKRTREILEDGLHPMLERGADTLVLACTHFPFVIPLIQEIAGDDAQVIDPSPAIARQVGRLLDQYAIRGAGSGTGTLQYITTGERSTLSDPLKVFGSPVGKILTAHWEDHLLKLD